MRKNWVVKLNKIAKAKVDMTTAASQLRVIARVAERNAKYGFEGIADKITEPASIVDKGKKSWQYSATIKIKKDNVRDVAATDQQFEEVLRNMARSAKQRGGWIIETSDEEPSEETQAVVDRELFRPPELTDTIIAERFGQVYQREPHIRIMHDACCSFTHSMEIATQNNDHEIRRGHVLLYGQPGGAKTILLKRFRAWYNSTCDDYARMSFIDAPTLSKAGIERWILDKASIGMLPEVIGIEEIDKTNLENLLSLISIMSDGYIARLNARDNLRKSKTNCIIWATCNDENVIRKFRRGVLWSRFVHRLYCSLPSQEDMRRILVDKVRAEQGEEAWVDLIMKFAYETYKDIMGYPMSDPRQIVGLLNGRERITDGSYMEDHIAIWQAEEAERDRLAEIAAEQTEHEISEL